MTWEAVLDQALAVLQRQFQLDDAALEDLKDELLCAYPQVSEDAGRGLIWTDDPDG